MKKGDGRGTKREGGGVWPDKWYQVLVGGRGNCRCMVDHEKSKGHQKNSQREGKRETGLENEERKLIDGSIKKKLSCVLLGNSPVNADSQKNTLREKKLQTISQRRADQRKEDQVGQGPENQRIDN